MKRESWDNSFHIPKKGLNRLSRLVLKETDHLITPFWYRFFRSDRNVNTCCQYYFKFPISTASQILLLKHPIRWDLINKGALILEYFLLIFEFLKKSRMSTWISSTSYKTMSGAQTWVLKNEVLEKSNTRFPAPPIKNDLTVHLLDTNAMHKFQKVCICNPLYFYSTVPGSETFIIFVWACGNLYRQLPSFLRV